MTMGFNGTNANVTSDAVKVPSLQLAGPTAFSVAGAAQGYVLIESNIGYITFGLQAAGNAGLTKTLGSTIVASGTACSFTAEIPISGW